MGQINLFFEKKYNLKIDSNVTLELSRKKVTFDFLVYGYGAKNGMIIDRSYEKISPYKKELVDLGYGFSCFELEIPKNDHDFLEMLNEWGKV